VSEVKRGPGRPKADTVNVWLKIRTRTAARLRAFVPVGKRSEFVTDAIEELLREYTEESK
jgi:hypothetical protein